jgi:hypothetical protein
MDSPVYYYTFEAESMENISQFFSCITSYLISINVLNVEKRTLNGGIFVIITVRCTHSTVINAIKRSNDRLMLNTLICGDSRA